MKRPIATIRTRPSAAPLLRVLFGGTFLLLALTTCFPTTSLGAEVKLIKFLDPGTGDSIEISLLAKSESVFLTENGKRVKATLKQLPDNAATITRPDGSVLKLSLDPTTQTFTDGKRVFAIPEADKPAILEAQQARLREFQCLQNAQSLSIACRAYAKANGTYPAKLEDLFTESNKYITISADKLASPFDQKRESLSYELLAPGKKVGEVGENDLLIRCKYLSPDGLRSVVYGNQRATFLKK